MNNEVCVNLLNALCKRMQVEAVDREGRTVRVLGARLLGPSSHSTVEIAVDAFFELELAE